MAIVGLVVAIPVTIAVRSGDSDDDAQSSAPELPEVEPLEFDRDVGVELRLPKGWKRKREAGVVSLTSPDKATLIAISTPGPAEDVTPIHAAAIEAIKSQYRDVEVVTRSAKKRLGGRPATVAAIAARHPKKNEPLRILVATAKGERLAYLVEVFATGTSGIIEAQVLLNNLALEG
jgi:hypothetical protein